MKEIDQKAKEIASGRFGLPACLHIPIAARDGDSIQKYIGSVSNILVESQPNKAFLVEIDEIPSIDQKLPIWRIKESEILHFKKQVWIHVDYNNYRKAYKKVFPDQDLTDYVLDHILNRKEARLKGFKYLRIIPIHRGVNTSSGVISEQYGVQYHSSPRMVFLNKQNEAFIQYADVSDIVKMLNIKTGGSFVDGIRDSLYLFEE